MQVMGWGRRLRESAASVALVLLMNLLPIVAEKELRDFRDMICIRNCGGDANNTACLECCQGCCWESTDCTQFSYDGSNDKCQHRTSDDKDDGEGVDFKQCLVGSECLMTCYGDLKCETCCKDCCQVENSECTSFTYYRRNHTHPCSLSWADGSEDRVIDGASLSLDRSIDVVDVITKACSAESRSHFVKDSLRHFVASGCPFSGLSSGQSGQGQTVDRSLFEPEDFDRVSSGDSELAELLRQYDEDRVAEAGMTEEEDRADPDVDIGGRGGARRREGSFWLKWIDLYSDNGGKEETREEESDVEESSELPAASEGRSSEACPSGLSVVLQPGDSVFVTSPGFPNHYPANARCSWSFEVAGGKGTVEFKISKIDLEHYLSCLQKDYLRISNLSPDSSDSGEETFCGRDGLGRTLLSAQDGGAATLEFSSDGEGERTGFNVMVSAR